MQGWSVKYIIKEREGIFDSFVFFGMHRTIYNWFYIVYEGPFDIFCDQFFMKNP